MIGLIQKPLYPVNTESELTIYTFALTSDKLHETRCVNASNRAHFQLHKKYIPLVKLRIYV